MTVVEWTIKQLMKKKEEMHNLFEEMTELESNLEGAETEYEGHYAMVEFVDGNQQQAQLYVEEEDGTSYNVVVHLEELLEILK